MAKLLVQEKQHITFCSTSYAKYDRRMQRIIEALCEDAYEVTWISRKHDERYDNDNVKQILIQTFFRKGILFYLEFNIRLFFSFIGNVDKVISSVDMDTILATRLYCLLRGKKFVFDSHEYFSEVPELNGKSFKKKIWKFIGHKCIPFSIQRYTVGDSLAQALSSDYGSEFKVVRNIAEYSGLSNGTIQSNGFKIVYLGVLNAGRGLEQLIESMKFLPDKYELILIGEGDLSKQLRRSVNENESLKNRVEFLGMVKPEKIGSILRQARVGTNLLVNSSKSYYLSLANKYFDYIHAQIPMIGMRFPEYQKLNESYETSILIDELNPIKISNAILSLEDDIVYKRLKSNCLSASQVLNWDTEKHKLLDIYREIFTIV